MQVIRILEQKIMLLNQLLSTLTWFKCVGYNFISLLWRIEVCRRGHSNSVNQINHQMSLQFFSRSGATEAERKGRWRQGWRFWLCPLKDLLALAPKWLFCSQAQAATLSSQWPLTLKHKGCEARKPQRVVPCLAQFWAAFRSS